MDRLKGKRAVVTAAGQGIGRAFAEAFHREGAEVLATDINEKALASLAGMATRRLDVTDGAAVVALAAELGAIDILANCAGYVHQGTILDGTEKDWDFIHAHTHGFAFGKSAAAVRGIIKGPLLSRPQ